MPDELAVCWSTSESPTKTASSFFKIPDVNLEEHQVELVPRKN